MSWIVTLWKFPHEWKSLDDVTDDFEFQPLGSSSEVLSLLTQLFPDADFSDSAWVRLDRNRYVIESLFHPKPQPHLKQQDIGAISYVQPLKSGLGVDGAPLHPLTHADMSISAVTIVHSKASAMTVTAKMCRAAHFDRRSFLVTIICLSIFMSVFFFKTSCYFPGVYRCHRADGYDGGEVS